MRIGVDLGGSKIEAIAINAEGEQLWRHRVDTPQGDYEATVTAIADLVARLEAELACKGSIGIGTPGSVSRVDGLMKNCNSTVLNGRPLQRDLAKALGRELRFANDADCFTLSEASDGAAAGISSVFGVILGTGVGGGLVVDSKVLLGPNSICGEWGHNPMPCVWQKGAESRACYCGQRDCIETWLSGPAFELCYFQHSGQRLEAASICTAASNGDLLARQCYERYVACLAQSLATVINIFDPYAIVLGGGMSNVDTLYHDVVSRWAPFVFSDRVDTRLLKAQHGDSSGVRGAACLWPC